MTPRATAMESEICTPDVEITYKDVIGTQEVETPQKDEIDVDTPHEDDICTGDVETPNKDGDPTSVSPSSSTSPESGTSPNTVIWADLYANGFTCKKSNFSSEGTRLLQNTYPSRRCVCEQMHPVIVAWGDTKVVPVSAEKTVKSKKQNSKLPFSTDSASSRKQQHYVFKHHSDWRSYMAEYRRNHSVGMGCGAGVVVPELGKDNVPDPYTAKVTRYRDWMFERSSSMPHMGVVYSSPGAASATLQYTTAGGYPGAQAVSWRQGDLVSDRIPSDIIAQLQGESSGEDSAPSETRSSGRSRRFNLAPVRDRGMSLTDFKFVSTTQNNKLPRVSLSDSDMRDIRFSPPARSKKIAQVSSSDPYMNLGSPRTPVRKTSLIEKVKRHKLRSDSSVFQNKCAILVHQDEPATTVATKLESRSWCNPADNYKTKSRYSSAGSAEGTSIKPGSHVFESKTAKSQRSDPSTKHAQLLCGPGMGHSARTFGHIRLRKERHHPSNLSSIACVSTNFKPRVVIQR